MEFLADGNNTFWLLFGISIFMVSIFLSWALFYVVQLLKNANSIIERVTSTLEKVDEILTLIKEKMGSAGTYMAVAMSAVKKIVEIAQDHKKSTKKKK